MIKKFLMAKHWQIFILMFAIPIALQMTMIGIAFADYDTPLTFLAFPIIMIITAGTLFTLFWSIGAGLNQKLPKNNSLKLNRFKVFFFFPLLYISFLIVYLTLSITGNNWLQELNLGNQISGFGIVVLVILHLFSMFCMFYMLYFCAKTIKSIELNREAQVSEYILEFILLWFYFIGVWILQPKLNKYAAQHYSQQRI